MHIIPLEQIGENKLFYLVVSQAYKKMAIVVVT